MHTDEKSQLAETTADAVKVLLRSLGSGAIWLGLFAARYWMREDARFWLKIRLLAPFFILAVITVWGLQLLRRRQWSWFLVLLAVPGLALLLMFLTVMFRRYI